MVESSNLPRLHAEIMRKGRIFWRKWGKHNSPAPDRMHPQHSSIQGITPPFLQYRTNYYTMKFPRHVHHDTTVAAVLIIISVLATTVAGQEQIMAVAPWCEMGTCQNGIFSMETCGCQCIPPYCPDLIGDCTQPTNSCGGNPWTECVKGVDCRECSKRVLYFIVICIC